MTLWARTPEEDAAWVASKLKPIPDDVWSDVAGARTTERYEIVQGDTLYDISGRLFGDSKYWPKIWALNNDTITNPHLIRPGNQIVFMPGSGSSLPGVSIQSGGSLASSDAALGGSATEAAEGSRKLGEQVKYSMARSSEWRKLGPQPWESVTIQLPPQVDELGFDTRSRITYSDGGGFSLKALAKTERMETLGVIASARSATTYMMLGDVVFIQATGSDLQVGETYAITQEPAVLGEEAATRKVFSYHILGSVQIIGVKDGVFIGTITTSRGFIGRGHLLIPMPSKIRGLTAIPGPSPIEALVMVDRSLLSTQVTAQHKQVFLDRGAEDGIKPGMVFRVYQHEDAATGRKITDADYIISADVMVAQVSERSSTGIIFQGFSEIDENSRAVLMTDVTGLVRRRQDPRSKSLGTTQKDPLDNLDEQDVSGAMGPEEKQELRQLERWKQNTTDFATPPPPPAGGAIGDSIPDEFAPPPPASPATSSDDELLDEEQPADSPMEEPPLPPPPSPDEFQAVEPLDSSPDAFSPSGEDSPPTAPLDDQKALDELLEP